MHANTSRRMGIALVWALAVSAGTHVRAQSTGSTTFTGHPPGSALMPRPYRPHNIVVLLADDVGVDMVGAYEPFYANQPNPGYPNTTPSIDYLAATGLLFRDAWTNPRCSPTRAQILTGQPAFRSGIGYVTVSATPNIGLQTSQLTVPSMLRASRAPRYYTACVGKWHLADETQHPPTGSALPHPLGASSNRWFHRYAGSIGNLLSYLSWTKTFATPINPLTDECAPPKGGLCEAVVTDYATVDTADDAIHLIRTMPEPFFLYVSFNAPHEPLAQPLQPLSPAACQGIVGQTTCDFTGDTPSQARCMVQWLDNEIGRVVCAIESGPTMPDLGTTIVFLGDNGTNLSATVAPFLPSHAKNTVYQGGVNVPFIVKSPLVAPPRRGGKTRALVCTTDILATVAELAGVPLPPDPYGLRDSKSFVPVLLGDPGVVREYVYVEKFRDNFVPTAQGTPPPGYDLKKQDRAIGDESGFKLIQRVRRNGLGGFAIDEEFYDLRGDPHESSNRLGEALSGVEPYATRYATLRAQLDTSYPHIVTP